MTGVRCNSRRRQQGRTVLELLISAAIGLVILGALGVIYVSTTTSSRQSAAMARMGEDAAIALNLVGTSLRLAGFSAPRILMSPVGAQVDGAIASIPDRNFMGPGIRGCDHGFSNPTVASFADLACSASTKAPAAFAVRFEGGGVDESAAMQALLPPARDCLNQTVDSSVTGALGASYTLVESRFMVRIGKASGTSELFCGGNGNANFAAQPLVQFVEDMVVRYSVAADGRSRDVVQRGLTATQVAALDQNWSRVVTVDLCIVVRTADPDASDNGNYVDCSGGPATNADGYMRRAFRGSFTLRNRGGFAATAS